MMNNFHISYFIKKTEDVQRSHIDFDSAFWPFYSLAATVHHLILLYQND